MKVTLLLGNNLDRMKGIPPVGMVLSDPPYGLSFMGKEWDRLWETGSGQTKPGIGDRDIPWPSFGSLSPFGGANPSCAACGGRLRGAKTCVCDNPDWRVRGQKVHSGNQLGQSMAAKQARQMQANHGRWLQECYRLLPPEGLILAFSGTRTFHRLAAAMEEAGFTMLGLKVWTYGSGFPKSLNVAKSFDKAAGKLAHEGKNMRDVTEGVMALRPSTDAREYVPPEPVTDEAVRWRGWGTALKPAWEPVLVGQKP